MKLLLFLGVLSVACFARGDSLPSITVQPTNQAVLPNGTANLSVDASGATNYQWRFNGIDIPNATNAYLQVTNVQTTNTGYYMVVVQNSTGWVPSQLVYLSIARSAFDPNAGTVPFYNDDPGNPNAPARDQCSVVSGPISTGTAQVVAGPELDQMKPIGISTSVSGGYFDWFDQAVPTVAAGQTVYYKVVITHPCGSGSFAQSSTILKLVASDPSVSIDNLKFPLWPEWPEPTLDTYPYTPPPNQIKLVGESFSITNNYLGYTDFGTPTCQWRKDGKPIAGATNLVQISGGGWGGGYQAVLTVTNSEARDAGIYDVEIFGNNWLVGPKMALAIQTTGSSGTLQAPRINDTSFIADLVGISGRQYAVQWSSNLTDWKTFQTVSNATGTITITNTLTDSGRFYRALLLP